MIINKLNKRIIITTVTRYPLFFDAVLFFIALFFGFYFFKTTKMPFIFEIIILSTIDGAAIFASGIEFV